MKTTAKTIIIFGLILVSISACGSDKKPLEDLYFLDDFSDEASGWQTIDDPQVSAKYKNGSYLMSVSVPGGMAISPIGQGLSDVIIEVDAKFSSGGSVSPFGVICKYEDANNFYALIITSEGDFGIIKFQGDDASFVGTDDLGYSDAIKKGSSKNILRAECIGDRFALYANGELLVEVFDPGAPEGDIGLFTAAFGASDIHVSFDNFAVYQP